MEPKIHLLPEELTHKIAAGEVIERPASILKELMENALDAGATTLRIEIEKGGCTSIRIIDDGEGMDPADVPLAFRRHATSKLAVFDDLYRLSTFGFRGEALPSIAAIARVELLTRQPQAVAGTRIVVENGRIQEVRETGCPVGTAIFVSAIFDAVPVRKKFLKTAATEQAACLEVITRTALSHERVKIRVLSNGHQLWDIPAAPDKGQRLGLVLGKDTRDALLAVKGVRGNMSISGYISRPEVARSNTKSIYCYVNGRYVRDSLLNHAIMTAYRNLMEAKRYPAAALFIEIPPEDVDINVHPAKLEVRFRSPRELYGLIVEALLHSLARVSPDIYTGQQQAGPHPTPTGSPSTPAYQTRIEEALKRYTVYGGKKKLPYRDAVRETSGGRGLSGMPSGSAGFPAQAPCSEDRMPAGFRKFSSANKGGFEDTIPTAIERGPHPGIISDDEFAPPSKPDGANNTVADHDILPAAGERPLARMTYLGQAGGTYLVFSDSDGLILVDQHAAHERILYEQFRQAGAGEKVIAQPLLLPEVVSLSPGDHGLLMENIDILKETGLEVEPFGGHTVVIKSLPAILGHLNPQGLLQDLIGQLAGEGSAASWQDKRDKVLISLACKGAIKAGQTLSGPEISQICRDLDRLPFAATCPHGRPVWIVITGKQLARLFKRT
ncbi:MAG: DNA mismatch repair endonuclease MutL [Syntrophales bacterium]